MGRNKSVGIGRQGEYMARMWFKMRGWVMFRVQPETRVIMIKGKPVVIPVKTSSLEDGIADFIGYEITDDLDGNLYLEFRCCEVKSVHGRSCPKSTFARQHDWLLRQPDGCTFVAIWWLDYGKFTVHEYKGEGIKYEG